MFDVLFDLPSLVTGPAIVGALCLFALGGLLVVRKWVLPQLRVRETDSEFTGAMLQAVMVFYGLAVALIAVSVWQSYSDAARAVSQEAATIGALYRDVSLYPQPLRSQLQQLAANHLDYLIDEAWPVQHQGRVAPMKAEIVNPLLQLLATFEPTTEGQKIQHAETLRAMNAAILATRLRVDASRTGLPGVLWLVIILGALISLSASFFFKVEDLRLHAILVTLLAMFVGLILFMILAFDRPFRGDLGLGSEPFQLIQEQLLKPRP